MKYEQLFVEFYLPNGDQSGLELAVFRPETDPATMIFDFDSCRRDTDLLNAIQWRIHRQYWE